MKVTATLPLKFESKRVPGKNFKRLRGTDVSLMDLKIRSLLECKYVDEILINTDNQDVISGIKFTYKDPKIRYHIRDPYFATSQCSATEFFVDLAKSVNTDIMVYTPCTSPFIKPATIDKCIYCYLTNPLDNDSVATVFNMKDHMWRDGIPMNYDPNNVPNSQDLPDIYKITYGACVIPKQNVIDKGNVVGDNPYFIELDEEEAVDIDTPLDFEFAEYLYNKRCK